MWRPIKTNKDKKSANEDKMWIHHSTVVTLLFPEWPHTHDFAKSILIPIYIAVPSERCAEQTGKIPSTVMRVWTWTWSKPAIPLFHMYRFYKRMCD